MDIGSWQLGNENDNDNDDYTAELRLIVARRQVNVAEPRLIATGSLVNAAELLCCNDDDDVDDNENRRLCHPDKAKRRGISH